MMDETRAEARLTSGLPGAGSPEAEPAMARSRPFETRERPFCIVVFGDLSARDHRDAPGPATASWSAVPATPDNLPGLAGFRPSLELPLRGEGADVVRIELRELNHLHPDTLFREHPLFGPLREARRAVREGREPGIELDAGGSSASRPPERERREAEESSGRDRRAGPAPTEGDGGLLDEIVDRSEPGGREGARRPSPDDELLSFVREIVRPHLVPAEPDRSADLAAVDRAASELMRRVLHAEPFRAAEALWRALVFLLSRIDTTGKVRVHLVDVSKKELERDLAAAGDPAESKLGRILADPASAGGPFRWALAVGAYAFGPGEASLFGSIGRAARTADVPWVSAADPRLAGVGTDEPGAGETGPGETAWPGEWRDLREAGAAAWLGLAVPRFLLREPWGSELAPSCRAFAFHEEPAEGDENRGGPRPLLWGNPAFLVAAVLARAFAREGWGFSPSSALDLGQVPVAPGVADDRAATVTEIRLRPSTAGRLTEAGFMGVIGVPAEARLRVAGVRAIASGRGGLAAWWNRT